MTRRPPADGPPRLEAQILGDLWIFRTIAREGGVAAAGRLLGASQAAMSQRLLRLEGRLGTALFERGSRGLCLTGRGRRLLEATEDADRRLTTALVEIAPPSDASLVVNCVPSLASCWLLPALDRLERALPDVVVNVRADQTPLTVDRMEREGIGVGIRYDVRPAPGLFELAAVEERLMGVCSPAYLERMRAGPVVRLLDEAPWPDAGVEAEWNAWISAAYEDAPPQVGGTSTFNLASLAYDAAEAGRGVAIGRAVLVRDRLRAGTLRPVSSRIAVGAAYRLFAIGRLPSRSAARRFVRWASEDLAAVRDDGLAAADGTGHR